MSEFVKYRRTQIAEMADWAPGFDMTDVSVSEADRKAGSPRTGDKIARNPANHEDRWLVAADYFAANFEALASAPQQAQETSLPPWPTSFSYRYSEAAPSQPPQGAEPEQGYFGEREALEFAAQHLSSDWPERCQEIVRRARAALSAPQPRKLWLWQNFVDGRREYWAFDNPFPVHLDYGDPQVLGEPCGYALFKPSRAGRSDVDEAEVLRRINAVWGVGT
jgi:hypothetical protein